jgi:N-acylneuraminate cytidylyltransferase
MWVLDGDLMRPLLEQVPGEVPTHSRQYKSLPEVYVQNSSLEIAWAHVLAGPRPEIAGGKVAPFFTRGWEGFSIDYPDDVEVAARAIARGEAELPEVA